MNSFVKVGMGLCFAAALSYGANMNGKLLDASCYDNSQTGHATTDKTHGKLDKTCAATATTSNFALMTSSGKVYKLDNSGNEKATQAFKNGTLKPDNDGDVHANVSGTMEGDTFKVDSLSAGKSETRTKENTR